MLIDKFAEISTLIGGTNYTQAQDECVNGGNECIELKNALENIKTKCIDLFGSDELFTVDFAAVINTI